MTVPTSADSASWWSDSRATAMDGGSAGNAGAITCHALAADGVFYPSGSFRVLGFGFLRRPTSSIHAVVPPLTEDVLTEGLRHRVLAYLCEKAGFDPELAQRMRQWQHSGF